MKELRLPLTEKWFEMTKSGVKTEDYREIKPHWFKRLFIEFKPDNSASVNEDYYNVIYTEYYNLIRFLWTNRIKQANEMLKRKSFKINTMTLGYPKSTDKDRILKLEHKGIEIRKGNPDWGANPEQIYFVIKHGKIIK